MAGQRDRIIEIINYLSSRGVTVNIGKNKARGNRGVFLGGGKHSFRIDIAKELPDDKILQVLIHEFAHYVHYCYDPKMESLDFLYGNLNDEIYEELINVTVHQIPKSSASCLYETKKDVQNKIKASVELIKTTYPDFRPSKPYKRIEKSLRYPVKYLLSYDNVRVLCRIYSVRNLESDFPALTPAQSAYIFLKSQQRALGRINSKISKLNRYYNRPSELFARFAELYFLSPEKSRELAPIASSIMDDKLINNSIPEFVKLKQILSNVEVL